MMRGIFIFVTVLCLAADAEVSLDLYYESLCPDSTRFISQQIGPMHEAIGQDVAINFVPYGFATVNWSLIDIKKVKDVCVCMSCPLLVSNICHKMLQNRIYFKNSTVDLLICRGAFV